MSTVPTIEITDLTPALAEKFLAEQAPNRRKKLGKIRQFARDMTEGRWRFTGEAVKFDTEGRMIDGQNRCQAVIDCGVTVRVLVIRGLEPDTQAVMDAGTPRSTRDALTFAGHTNVKDLNAVISAHRAWLTGGFTHCMASLAYYSRPTNSEIVAYAEQNPETIAAAEHAKSIYNRGLRLPVGAIAVAIIETAKIAPAQSADFFDRIVNLRTAGKGDPIHTLLKRVDSLRDQGHRVDTPMALYLMFRTWNAFRDGELLQKFQVGAPARGGKPATWAAIPEPK